MSDGNKWSNQFKSVKDRITRLPGEAVNDITNGISDGISSIGNSIKDGVQSPIKKAQDKIVSAEDRIDNLTEKWNNAKGVTGKAKLVGTGLANAASNTDVAKKINAIKKKIKKIISTIYSHIVPISIITGIVIFAYNVAVWGISGSQGIGDTLHNYCDVDASPKVKNTDIYRQYCGEQSDFDLSNLNGHYVVQDGSGPCTDCSTLNMLIRYYTNQELNIFDYLWDETGKYTPQGQAIIGRITGTFRTVIPVGSGSTSCNAHDPRNSNYAYGSQAFASRNGKSNYTMANWGYLRDDTLDIASYEETSDFYSSNVGNSNWVWDLSLENRASNSSWAANWSGNFTVNGITAKEVTNDSQTVTGETIKSLLNDSNVCGEAGILLYYQYDGNVNNRHAILVTKYDSTTGYWFIVDPAKGLAGGYEGPTDGSNNFCWQENKVTGLLNSGQHIHGNEQIVRICYITK